MLTEKEKEMFQSAQKLADQARPYLPDLLFGCHLATSKEQARSTPSQLS